MASINVSGGVAQVEWYSTRDKQWSRLHAVALGTDVPHLSSTLCGHDIYEDMVLVTEGHGNTDFTGSDPPPCGNCEMVIDAALRRARYKSDLPRPAGDAPRWVSAHRWKRAHLLADDRSTTCGRRIQGDVADEPENPLARKTLCERCEERGAEKFGRRALHAVATSQPANALETPGAASVERALVTARETIDDLVRQVAELTGQRDRAIETAMYWDDQRSRGYVVDEADAAQAEQVIESTFDTQDAALRKITETHEATRVKLRDERVRNAQLQAQLNAIRVVMQVPVDWRNPHDDN